MLCEKCGKEHDGKFGTGRFCSRECSNSRVFSEESRRLKSEANKKRYIDKGTWGGTLPMLTEEEKREILAKRAEKCKKDLLESNFDGLSYERKKKRVILEQNGKCSGCGLSEWRGKRLGLEIDHKNGNHSDNSRINLESLCPNCHSITPTWRGRNKKKDDRWLSGEEMYSLYKSGKSIRQILLLMGLAAKGDNYAKAGRIIDKLEPSQSYTRSY